MKRILCLVMALMLLAAPALAEELRVGMECDYAPFNWTQTEPSETSVPIESGGHADGYDVQIAKRIAEGLGRDLVIVKTEWDGLPLSVMSGTIDAIIAGMSPTAERALMIDFSQNYYTSDLVIVVRADGAYAGATQLSDFSGAKITGQLNTFHYSVIDQIEGVQMETAMDTFPAMIVALKSGAIDGYVSERPGALYAMYTNPELAFVVFEEGNGFEASMEDRSIAVGLMKGSELTPQIDEILAGITDEERATIMEEAIKRRPE